MLHWLPDELWNHVRPRVAIQNDVNGFPRAGAMALLDRDVPYLLMGINATNGGPPVEMPDGVLVEDARRAADVRLAGRPLRGGFLLFPSANLATRAGSRIDRHPVPAARDAGIFSRRRRVGASRPPASARQRLAQLEADGYTYPSLIVSVTNEWRMDNDPPFPPLADFVADLESARS